MDQPGRIEAADAGRLIELVVLNAMRGELVKPRGRVTREQLGVSARLLNGRNNVFHSLATRTNHRFMVAEWVWMMAGMEVVAPLARYNSKMLQFSDDGFLLSGAYGPKILSQQGYVIHKLIDDPDTRQAVMTIWRPNPLPSKDIPCTIAAQFIRRGQELNAVFTMRSSDAVIGLKYDVFCFGQILNYYAGLLNLGVGWLQMNFGSSHVYEEDWEDAARLPGTAQFVESPPLVGYLPHLLVDCLRGVDCDVDDELLKEPWLRYGKALVCQSSVEALAVLGLQVAR